MTENFLETLKSLKRALPLRVMAAHIVQTDLEALGLKLQRPGTVAVLSAVGSAYHDCGFGFRQWPDRLSGAETAITQQGVHGSSVCHRGGVGVVKDREGKFLALWPLNLGRAKIHEAAREASTRHCAIMRPADPSPNGLTRPANAAELAAPLR